MNNVTTEFDSIPSSGGVGGVLVRVPIFLRWAGSEMSFETMKLSFHHRAFHCYIVMTLWILFLVIAMYKYMGNSEEVATVKKSLLTSEQIDLKLKKIISTHCRPADEIRRGAEGAPNPDQWQLEGVLIVTRHGDRGPLAHLRDGDKLPCNTVPQSTLLQSYSEYVWNASAGGRASWVQAPGPFHNFPTLPVQTTATSCALGQLTLHGVNQMLVTGAIMKEAYAERLGLLDTDDHKLVEIKAYSTRYRRTFQSALAVLWALLPRAGFPPRASRLRESHSVAFCFRDCACGHADRLARRLSIESKKRLETHPAILRMVLKMSKVALESAERADAEVVRDALLASLCHGAPLPCADLPRRARSLLAERQPLDFDTQMEREKLTYYREHYADYGESRRQFDSDFNFHQPDADTQYETTTSTASPARSCVRSEHASALFAYADWSAAAAARGITHRKKSALDAYGLIRHMVQQTMGALSSGRPRLVYYSGHDRTLRALAAALGLPAEHPTHYASRLVVELYRRRSGEPRDRSVRDAYVRCVWDGDDVTGRLSLCRGWHNVALPGATLCPLENLVRFLHDDYFAAFNATNYRDACAAAPER